MTSSQGKEGPAHDKANAGAAGRRAGLAWGGVALLVALAALAFVGYRQPELLLEFANLRYCG